ncbi:hypothetical protein V6N13_078111 [Hibiscus sabdariffa]
MPSPRMKTKSSMDSLREKNSLRVCPKSSMICKRPCCHVRVSQQGAKFNTCIQNFHDEVASQVFETDGAGARQLILDGGDSELQKQLPTYVDSATVGGMESTHTPVSNLETIFSPLLEPIQMHGEVNIDNDAGDSLFQLGVMMVLNCQHLELMTVMIEAHLEVRHCSEPSMLFDVAEQYMILPFLEDTVNTNDINDVQLHEESMVAQDNTGLCLAIDEMRSCIQESDVNSDSDQADDFDPQSFIKNLPELSDVVSSFRPDNVPTEAWKRKPITLVLDLDETLVHSTLEHCDDADFTFTVFFNMKEHTVYVKQRPHLQTFLEKVAEMFEVIIFTASQSIYAEQLLDILDPDRKFISRRVYRESCIFSDGNYTKDLTVLGVDLAKVAIIDNFPQVFRLQVNNGIPIKSWFDDPSDCALISLLPFLETLVDVDDVRPIIAKKFGNKE